LCSAQVGSPWVYWQSRGFEEAAHLFWKSSGIALTRNFIAPVGFRVKKDHKFDLGSEDPPILVECKSFTWTSGGNSPSAKIRGMKEVMLLFSVAPPQYRKILFVLKHMHERRKIGSRPITSRTKDTSSARTLKSGSSTWR
jgi:hypothetical protein